MVAQWNRNGRDCVVQEIGSFGENEQNLDSDPDSSGNEYFVGILLLLLLLLFCLSHEEESLNPVHFQRNLFFFFRPYPLLTRTLTQSEIDNRPLNFKQTIRAGVGPSAP